MSAPEGKLTPAQFEIMQLVWSSPDGLTIAEIWDDIRKQRDVSRTTILNLVDRLEKRGWLSRQKAEGPFRYLAAIPRQSAEGQLAAEFVKDFFNGSASELVMSLLGSRRVSNAEVERLKQLLQDDSTSTGSKRRS